MPQLNLLTLDGVQLHPVRVDANGVASLRARGESVTDALTVSLQVRPSKTSATTKLTSKIAIPYWYSPKGDTSKKARETARVDVTVIIPPNASAATRADVYKKLKALVDNASFKESMENLEAFY